MSGERYQPNFKWIDATAPPARREINLHARRETQRARLWRGQRRGLKDRQSLARLSKYSWRSGAEPPESNAPFDRPLSGSDEHGFSEAAPSSKATKTSSVGVLGDFPSDAVLYSPYPHGGLQDAVTTSRRDPFLSLPLVTSREDQALIDHYVVGMMSLYAKINHDMPSKTVLFSLATSGPLALRSIVLVFAATHLAWIHGLNDSVQSTQHKSQVLCDLRSRVAKITSGRSIDAGGDDTIAAIFGMASFENQFGDKASARAHTKAGMELLRIRGNSNPMPADSRLGVYANWVDYTTTTPLFLNELPAFSCRPIHPLNPEQSPLANEIGGANDLEAFIQFLFNAEMLSSFHKRLDPVWFAHRHQMFKRGTVLHKLLTPPAEGDEWPRNRIPSYCIMAALMHIHVAFWENREARDLGDQCLKDLHRNLEQYYRGLSSGEEQGYPIHPNTSIGLFVWLLLKMDLEDQDQHVSGHCPMDEGRSWFVARVLRVAKLLSYRSWLRLNRVLLSLLEMTPDEVHGLASPETMAAWRDELRVEFLLTAFPW